MPDTTRHISAIHILPRRIVSVILGSVLVFGLAVNRLSSAAAAEDFSLFESRIRPVLVHECYECHNSHSKTKGGLSLDYRDGLRRGGDSGPAVVPYAPEQSLLLRAIRHDSEELRMPSKRPKLSAEVIADFTAWIKSGAPDPRDRPAPPSANASASDWSETFKRRLQWWSWQPIRSSEPPEATGARAGLSTHPVDRFIEKGVRDAGLEPAAEADRRVWIRRVTFSIIGLPPTPEEIEQFLADSTDQAHAKVVDRLLASPQFGERWARHWMDWLRYAESHGSEGDPAIPFAWRYRDYLIRALNEDVPVNQLIREHLAGDLVPSPRINREQGILESNLGLGHLRMVFHGFAPTDALDEQVRFTENQIDVVTKAFLGLTVSCARCHDHKFDAISQADFYALYGVMASTRPALQTVDVPDRLGKHRDRLLELKRQLRGVLARAWQNRLDQRWPPNDDSVQKVVEAAEKDPRNPLRPWARLRSNPTDAWPNIWETLAEECAQSQQRLDQRSTTPYPQRWDLAGPDYRAWLKQGSGLAPEPASAGSFRILPEGDRILDTILPAGAYTHLLSSKQNGVLQSPRFQIEGGELWVRVMGGDDARIRYVVQNYPRALGLVYGSAVIHRDTFEWQKWDLDYWSGDAIHVEVATAADVPVEVKDQPRSWFGVTEAMLVAKGQPAPREEMADYLAPLFAPTQPCPATQAELIQRYRVVLTACVRAWRDGTIHNDQANFLGHFVRLGWLPVTLLEVPEAADLLETYRRLELEIPIPTRAPAVVEGTVYDQPLMVRGNPKDRVEPVPRRFLDALGARPYPADQSGRLELAEDIVHPNNPLTSRVMVNRVWHHLFGRGLVPTPDNFGALGELPTHPDLLDYLATQFQNEGWSLKRLIRLLVTSRTYQQASSPSPSARLRDPDNRWWSHFPVRRLEAEAIRDAILAVSGRLDTRMFGPSVSGQNPRRSVYVNVIRNDLDPFLAAFDAPEPLTTRGRRNVTNVPGQSLTLLNNDMVIANAQAWARRLLQDPALETDTARLRRLHEEALGRPPGDSEIDYARQYLLTAQRIAQSLARDQADLESALNSHRQELRDLLEPARQRILESRHAGHVVPPSPPAPLAHWDFESDAHDRLAQLQGTLIGEPRIEGGALHVKQNGYLRSSPLPVDLKEKSLEVRVRLANLEQQGGGAMSAQSLDGHVFDAVVFAEQEPQRWMAGSDYFRRTQSFQGPAESEAASRAVHLVITYRSDGLITGYRDGQPYGQSYRSDGPVLFRAGQTVVLFGCRHEQPGGNKGLEGQILDAKLYNRALTAGEVADCFANGDSFISEAELASMLTPDQLALRNRLESQVAELSERLEEIRRRNRPDPTAESAWADLAQTLFNLKEFIYIR